MDLPDNFISYTHDDFLKMEKIDEQEYSLSSPNSGETDSTGFYLASHPFQNTALPIQSYYNQGSYYCTDYITQRKCQPFQIIKTKKEEDTEIQVKVEAEEKILSKSKRIMKREKAKERTKSKNDATSFLSQVNSKYIPEGFNNPDLDEKTRKKMIQMIRNRISAQNSRDRKKAYVQQLEGEKKAIQDQVRQLTQEKDALLQEYRKLEESHARLLKENEDLKKNKNFACIHCGKLQDTDIESQNNSEDTFEDNLSLPSPTRYSSGYNRTFFNYAFAFATILSCVMIMHIQNQGSLPVQVNTTPDTQIRLLQESTEIAEKSEIPCFKPLNEAIGSTGSFVLKNIRPLKQEFQDRHKSLYHSDCEKRVIITPADNDTSIKIEETDHPIVEYKTFHNGDFLSKEGVLMTKNLPVLNLGAGMGPESSTLFCPNGIELVDEEIKEGDMEDENKGNSKTSLGKSQYLQLFVPKNAVSKLNIWNKGNNIDYHVSNDNGNENSIVELWCKVFMARELSSNF